MLSHRAMRIVLLFFLAVTPTVSFSQSCLERLAGWSPAAAWDSGEVRRHFFAGFRLEGIPSAAPVASHWKSGRYDKFLRVARRLAWIEKVKPETNPLSQLLAFDGQSEEHTALWELVQTEREQSSSEYGKALRRIAKGLILCEVIAVVTSVATPCLMPSHPAAGAGALALFGLSMVKLYSLTADQSELAGTAEGIALENLKVHQKLVSTPEPGGWAATAFTIVNGFWRYEYPSLVGEDEEWQRRTWITSSTDGLDVYTWVDAQSVPHTRVLRFNAESRRGIRGNPKIEN
jgi:hypothetical protein